MNHERRLNGLLQRNMKKKATVSQINPLNQPGSEGHSTAHNVYLTMNQDGRLNGLLQSNIKNKATL